MTQMQFRQSGHRHAARAVRLSGELICLALSLSVAGCASRRPAPLLVQEQTMVAPATGFKDGHSLKLVTYNIWGLPSWMTGARSGRYPKIARELERLDPDIVLLQEAWTANARKSVPATGRWSTARAAGQHTFFQQSGLVTLARFPIAAGEFYPFSHSAFPDRFVNKGVLKVTVRLPGGSLLNVWNVHLQDGGSPALRLSQVRELVSHVLAAEDGQIADLVGGDFNCTPGSPPYEELARSLGPTVQQLSGAAPFVTWDGLSPDPGAGETLDHIFIKLCVPVQELDASPHVAFAAPNRDQRLSDHLGVEADITLNPASVLAEAANPLLKNVQLHGFASTRAVAGGRE